MNPTFIAARIGQRKVMARVNRLRWEEQRHADARKHGYRGPLTREEAARVAVPAAAVIRSRKVMT